LYLGTFRWLRGEFFLTVLLSWGLGGDLLAVVLAVRGEVAVAVGGEVAVAAAVAESVRSMGGGVEWVKANTARIGAWSEG
jgi:hypothetical protein